MDKVKNPEEHIWYAEQAAQNGWSRNVLVHQIESGLYQRQVLAEKVSNFGNRLPSPQSELAVQTMKDPYIFDFIPFKADMVERDIEQALVKDVSKPIGVSAYQITSSLPEELERQLPSVEDIQKRIKGVKE